MGRRLDYIPRKDAEFSEWLNLLLLYVKGKCAGTPPEWAHIPAPSLDEFSTAVEEWNVAYAPVLRPHTSVDTKEKNRVRARVEKDAREFVNKYLRFEPVSDLDRSNMGVRSKTGRRRKIPIPRGQCTGAAFIEGLHLVLVRLLAYIQALSDDQRAEFGVRIYYGIMPPGGATVEEATGPHRLLMKPPTVGEELCHSVFTRKLKRNIFDFEGFSGMTVFFCCHYENEKGEVGPFGPIFSSIIT
ncbi:MAG: hypothetical protein LBS82_04590 [Spirochaetaceae bacterium]|jgi:hypothetical protein|nr:hypothetical protein [Spirochaetaceae bacterium]